MLPKPSHFKTLFTEEQLKRRVQEMGLQISEKFASSEEKLKESLITICVLKGSFIFYSDLIRNINRDFQCDFISASFFPDHKNLQNRRLTLDLASSIKNQHVLLVTDIVSSGLTLEYLINIIKMKQPTSLTTATLILKKDSLKANITLDYVGFEIEKQTVLGYGIEHQGYYRNLPYIAQIQETLN